MEPRIRKALLSSLHLASRDVMGELVGVDAVGSGFGLLSGVLSLAALGIYALVQGNARNDDDDSSPGGGLMQPVA